MAEQVLDGLKSPHEPEDAWRTMAECMWRRGFGGQARRASAPSPNADARQSRAALAPTNNGPAGVERIGAKRQILLDRPAHRGDDRRRAGLLAFADDRDRHPYRRSARRRVGLERLGDAQARAVAERQHRGVARQHPGSRASPSRNAVVVMALASGALKGRGRRRQALARVSIRALRLFGRFRARYGGRAI